MTERNAPTFNVDIHMAGDVTLAAGVIQRYASDIGMCVTLAPQSFIYTGGREEGFRVGFINYPRFPKEPSEIVARARDLASVLRVQLGQHSYSIVTPIETIWVSHRPEDMPTPPTHVEATYTQAECDELCEIAERDGYEKAVQDIDQLTGGDGEYRVSMLVGGGVDDERHTPDAASMIQRIVDRFEILNLLDDATKTGADQPDDGPTRAHNVGGLKPLEWEDRSDHNSRNSYAKTSIGRYEAFEFTMDMSSGPTTIFGWSCVPWIKDQHTDSFEAAKAAAQSDFEARVRACLATAAEGNLIDRLPEIADKSRVVAAEAVKQFGREFSLSNTTTPPTRAEG